ncbi:MAG: sugar ABC transporter permease [Alphaproteobacteria bacterium]
MNEPTEAGKTSGSSVQRLPLSHRLLANARSAPGLIIAIAIIWLIFVIATDGIFISDRNLVNLMRQTSVTAIIAMGMMVVIAQGEIDLSVGSMLGVICTVIALLESSGAVPFWVTILVALALGMTAGTWNGLWVARLGIPAFVATLGGLLAFRGISRALSGGRTIAGVREEIRFMGEAFLTGPILWAFLAAGFALALLPLRRMRGTDPVTRRGALIASGAGLIVMAALSWATLSYRGLPLPVAIALGVAVVLAWALRNTVWGRHVYAIGGNRLASRVAGIPIGFQVVSGFVLIGVLTALGALLFVGRLGSAPPEAGLFLELEAIAAVVIGGASLYGGSGTVVGVLLGALLMQSLSNGLSLLNVETAYQNITSGLVLMLAVYVDAVSKRGGRPFVRL